MRIVVSPHSGFCFGVHRAIEVALEAVREHGKVYCVGPLIHNRQAVEELRREGLDTVASLDDVPAGAPVLVRTHGAGPELYRRSEAGAHELIDATCPFVMRAQEAARQYQEEGYQVLVLGDKQHPEAQGIVQHTGDKAIVIQGAEELAEIEVRGRVAVVCQTTQRVGQLQALVEALMPLTRELRVANTICDATTQRQQASEELAREVDVMIVVGGYHSANTSRLAQICAATGTPTHHVETAEELEDAWFAGADVAGVSAGASTPDEAIAAVAERVAELGGEGSRIEWSGRNKSRGGEVSR